MRIAAAFALVVTLAVLPARAGDATPSFAGEVLGRFEAWDADRDGRISLVETDALIDDPKVKGPEAAALAVLKRIQRSDKYGRPEPDREMLLRFTKGARLGDDEDAGSADADDSGTAAGGAAGTPPEASSQIEPLPDVERMFNLALTRVRKASRSLFDEGGPDLSTVRQGPIGDCFFIAPVGAALARDPAAVRALFTARPDGSCDVAFPGGRRVRVPPLTDTELALTSWTGGRGVWLNVLEKAYAKLRNNAQPAAMQKDSVTDAIASGGSPALVLRLLTGGMVRQTLLRPQEAVAVQPTAEEAAARLPKLREELRTAMQQRALVCCSTWREQEVPGISKKHAYAVLGFDAAKDTVEVWNPHGNRFEPKGTPGLDRGYPTRRGRFTIPLADFARIFARAVFEVRPEPATEK